MSNIEFYEVKDAKRTVISFTFDIEFLNSLNLGELKEIMNKLDFSNFSIVRNVVE